MANKPKTRSYLRDLGAGIDPFGTISFKYGMKDVKNKVKRPGRRRTVNTIGGIIGGTTLVPSTTYGAVQAVKGFSKPGNIRSRLARAGSGFLQGAKYPYQAIGDASKTLTALKTNTVTERTLRAVRNLFGGSDGMASATNTTQLSSMIGRMKPQHRKKLESAIKDKRNTAISAIAAGGMTSGGAANVQYRAGRKTRKKFQRELKNRGRR